MIIWNKGKKNRKSTEDFQGKETSLYNRVNMVDHGITHLFIYKIIIMQRTYSNVIYTL